MADSGSKPDGEWVAAEHKDCRIVNSSYKCEHNRVYDYTCNMYGPSVRSLDDPLHCSGLCIFCCSGECCMADIKGANDDVSILQAKRLEWLARADTECAANKGATTAEEAATISARPEHNADEARKVAKLIRKAKEHLKSTWKRHETCHDHGVLKVNFKHDDEAEESD